MSNISVAKPGWQIRQCQTYYGLIANVKSIKHSMNMKHVDNSNMAVHYTVHHGVLQY